MSTPLLLTEETKCCYGRLHRTGMYVTLQNFKTKDSATCMQCQEAASATRRLQRAGKKATAPEQSENNIEVPSSAVSSNKSEKFSNETAARIWLKEYLDNEPVPFRKPHVKSGKCVETSGSNVEANWKVREPVTLRIGSIWKTEMLYCMCHGASRATISSTNEEEKEGNSQRKLLAELNEDGSRKRKAPRRGIWAKITNRIGCPKTITLRVFIDRQTFGAGAAEVQIHHQHLPVCERHAEVRMVGPLREWVESCMDAGVSNRNMLKIFNNPDSLSSMKQIENVAQARHRSSYFDVNDTKSTSMWLEQNSVGLRAEDPPRMMPLPVGTTVLYYQLPKCFCNEGSNGIGNKNHGCVRSIGCQPFMAVLQHETMRKFATENMIRMCELDATGTTNIYRWFLYAAITYDHYGMAMPIGFLITSWESNEPITKFLQVLKETMGSLFTPSSIGIDKSDTEILGIRKYDPDVFIYMLLSLYASVGEMGKR